ncbi:WGxxGxxG family protein [Mycobacterium bourgelatii]|uniref:LPXTG cell wall anchor domain-containing protein n=1 Tax=Mycobacterium bourgelatii TaxID=1273442 RepID=A0A7I9YXG0_MYCBU|nr:WGxxGxxG family protein [Mycobacterium bourgelatii]MCV6973255.1 LPXTG cell wall anchor domain-containing protein [Mycobacterium bourgelatii]GFG93293.1 hypothetical protein MBOU_53350 [Mycobacterium bourgelatii]
MRKSVAVMAATGALVFGGAGVANAAPDATMPASTTTTLAVEDNDNNDNTGLWGLAGLLGLLGLAGLKRRNDAGANVRPGAGTVTNNPRGGAV